MMYKMAFSRMALSGKLSDGDPRWEQLNAGFENMELDTLDIANNIYAGKAYTAWHNGRRCTENFVCAQFIAVDLETHDKRSTLDYLLNMEIVKVYGSLLYTTPSHTEADPRARVLFFLDQPICSADAYKSAIEFMYSMIPGSDPNCIKASGFFYGSKDCQMEWPNNVLPLVHLRSYYTRWLKTKPATQKTPERKPATQATQPQTTTETEVADALKKIDPWKVDYKTWVAILGALHDNLGGYGLSLAEQWADAKPGEIKRMWHSFDYHKGRKATLATVFGAAVGKVH